MRSQTCPTALDAATDPGQPRSMATGPVCAVRGASVLRPRLVLRQPAVALEVAQPARRVAVNDQLLVVEVRVAVRVAVALAVRAKAYGAGLGGTGD